MKNYIIANFKMYLSRKEKINYWIENFLKQSKGVKLKNTELVICPPAVFFEKIKKALEKIPFVSLGLQNCFWENEGSYTGEVSPSMIISSGGRYVILGHSERRKYLKESNKQISSKISKSLKENLVPILCVGENFEEKNQDFTVGVIKKQLRECLAQVKKGKIESVIICYEPIWAISSNQPNRLPTVNEIMGVKLLIRKFLTEKYGAKLAEKVAIIYGGSVDSKKINQACIAPEMQGALIGKASTLPYELLKTAQIMDAVDFDLDTKNIKKIINKK